jgi:hypothetical protein
MHAIVLATSKRAKKPRCYYLNVQLANEQKKRCYHLNVQLANEQEKRCYYLNVQLANEQRKTLLLFKCATSKRAKKKTLLLFKCFFLYIHTIVLTTSKRAKKSYYYLNIYLFQQLAKSK